MLPRGFSSSLVRRVSHRLRIVFSPSTRCAQQYSTFHLSSAFSTSSDGGNDEKSGNDSPSNKFIPLTPSSSQTASYQCSVVFASKSVITATTSSGTASSMSPSSATTAAIIAAGAPALTSTVPLVTAMQKTACQLADEAEANLASELSEFEWYDAMEYGALQSRTAVDMEGRTILSIEQAEGREHDREMDRLREEVKDRERDERKNSDRGGTSASSGRDEVEDALWPIW